MHIIREDDLIAFAKDNLAPFKLPKRVLFASELPRNTAGKILKRTLRDTHEALYG